MKTNLKSRQAGIAAFTLIELLAVIAIMGILAGIVLAVGAGASKKAKINRAKVQLQHIISAIDAYKLARGTYPPDNQNPGDSPPPANPQKFASTPLFYELTGMVFTEDPGDANKVFRRIGGIETINQATVFGTYGIGGFVNAAQVANASDKSLIRETEVRDFLPGLEPHNYLTVTNPYPVGGSIVVMGIPVADGPNDLFSTDSHRINPWRYISSNPTNNPEGYDLWIDLVLGKVTNRICNWNSDVLVVK